MTISVWPDSLDKLSAFSSGDASTGIHWRFFKRIEDIPRQEWESLYPDTLESYDFFKTLDESHLDPFAFYYLMIYRENIPIGAAPCFLIKYEIHTTVQGWLRKVLTGLSRIFPSVFSFRVLVCGHPLGPGRIGFSGSKSEILQSIKQALEAMAAANQVSVIAFKDFYGEDQALLDSVLKSDFHSFESLPNTEMEVQFKTFEEYLKSLRSKYRSDLNRKFRKMNKLGPVQLEVKSRLDPSEMQKIYYLYTQTAARGATQFEDLTPAFFEKISENFQDRALYFLMKLKGEIVGFSLCLVSPERLTSYYVGFDYEVAYEHHLYFMNFRDMLCWCIDHKISVFEMGISNYDPKKRLSFKFISQYVYFKAQNRILHAILGMASPLLKPENFDLVLKRMKKQLPDLQN